jgi:heat-inducible transcriptional repressor
MTLSQRQQAILNIVAEHYIRGGAPVSSKEVASAAGFKASPSTVRNEFALLEERGLLTHPHTSAGRIPTNTGFRLFVDSLMDAPTHREVSLPQVGPGALAKEVDVALQQTSEALAQATNLLALIVAPRMSGARLRHVELLPLQPTLLMAVFIVSSGRVTKSVIDYPAPVDPGTVEWGRAYLNEVLADAILTERAVRRAMDNSELSDTERRFLLSLTPAFTRLLDEQSEEALYVGGAARLLTETGLHDISALRDLLDALEGRVLLLREFRSVLNSGKVVVKIGEELQSDVLHCFSVVAAAYGLPQRSLGTVSVLGPVRMDYEAAIVTVRSTAQLLSDFLEDRYE